MKRTRLYGGSGCPVHSEYRCKDEWCATIAKATGVKALRVWYDGPPGPVDTLSGKLLK